MGRSQGGLISMIHAVVDTDTHRSDLDLSPLERAWTEIKLAHSFLVGSAPKPRGVVDRVGARRPKRLFFADARWRRCSCSTRERRQPQVLRRWASVDDIVCSRRALQRGSGRRGRIVDMHEAVDALALTDNRNLVWLMALEKFAASHVI